MYLYIANVFIPGISAFAPKSKGTYAVNVTQDGKAISGSPFKVQVCIETVLTYH